MKNSRLSKSGWSWIPTLYIAEGLPYFAVNTLTVLMYTNLGISNIEMAFYTGWLYLPWVIKPIWSPFIDIFSTKRKWVLSMQALIALMMAGVFLTLPSPLFFSLTLVCFWLMAFFSATHDIAADGFYMLALDKQKQAAFVGVRSTAYRIASVFGQGVLVIIAGRLIKCGFSPISSWQWVFAILSAIFCLIYIWHLKAMPTPSGDKAMEKKSFSEVFKETGETFATFFAKRNIMIALLFILFYRLPEALCLKLVQPFMIDGIESGGLGLTVEQVGIANGTVGVVALLAGGILGGVVIARRGLRRWLWPMALTLTLPCALYCILAAIQPQNFILVCAFVGIEQFGYGFGFTAFMMYLIYFSQGKSATSHYAFCTAFMALGMMLPGMAAGWLWELSGGYKGFFTLVMMTCLATYLTTIPVFKSLKNKSEQEG